jgi:PAS domain S-box-containing protein
MAATAGEKLRRERWHSVYAAVFKSIPFGTLIVDRAGEVVDINETAGRLLGVSELSGPDARWSALFPELESSGELSALDAGKSWARAHETQLLRPDGRQIPVKLRAVEARTIEDAWIVVFLQDLRPRLMGERRMMQRERLAAIGETVTALAHESRNALQRMQSCLTLMRRREGAALDELIDDMQSAQNQLQTLYEEFRQYAAPMELELHPVDLKQLFMTVWRRLRLKWRPQQLRLSIIDGGDIDTRIDVDQARLGRVLRNLLENAIDASPAGARIELAFADSEIDGHPALQFVVKDYGPGIPKDKRQQVFELMYTTKREGTGMGLAIARRIVSAHDGIIMVEPDTPTGTEISVTLPRL